MKNMYVKFLLGLMMVFGVGDAVGQVDNLACPAGTVVGTTMSFSTTNFSIVHSKGTDANFASFTPWRVYTDNTVTFSGGSNVQRITSIVITATTNAYATAAATGVASVIVGTGTAILSASGSTVTITVTGSNVKGVMIDPSAQTRWSNIQINYELAGPSIPAPTVTSRCAGETFDIAVSSSGTFNTGNIYTAQLSDGLGSFDSPVSIGTVSSTANSATINATIPALTAYGTAYKIRVVASDPAVTGTESSAFTINTAATIGTHPSNATVTAPATANFGTIAITGGNPSPAFQWQVSTDGGTNWADVSSGTGATSNSYTTAATTIGMNGYQYRVKLTSGACVTYTNAAILTVNAPTDVITLNPSSQPKDPYCNASSNSISLTYTTTGTVTAPFLQLSDASGSFASGTTNIGSTVTGGPTYTITGTMPALQAAGTAYRVRIISTDAVPVISANNGSDIEIVAGAAVSTSPGNQSATTASAATFTATGVGTISWQLSTDGGLTWPTTIANGGVYSGATTASLVVTNPPIGMDGYQYRAVFTPSSPCTTPVYSIAAKLTVTAAPSGLGRYEFTSTTCNAARYAPTGVVPNLAFSQISTLNITCNNNVTNVFSGNRSWGTAFNNTYYIEFTITPDLGYMFTGSSLVFDIWRSGSGADNYVVRSNVDGFAANLQAGSITTSSSTKTILLDASFADQTSSLTFRIYGWGGNSTGDIRLDNFVLNGFVNPTCPAPTQASSLTANTATTDGFSLAWNQGNASEGTMLVVRRTADADQAPAATSYTPSLAWASAGQINANNRVVFRGDAGDASTGTDADAAGPVTGLNPETQYTVTAYSYTGTCYNQVSPATTTIYTLSTEPSAHPGSFSIDGCTYNTALRLNFSAANTIANADGYIILRSQGPTAPTTSGIADGMVYSSWSLLPGTTVVAQVTDNAATSFTDNTLSAGTQYSYLMIPYNYNGSVNATYNYFITGGPKTATGTTSNSSSNTIVSSSFSYSSDIDYLAYHGNGTPEGPITNTSNSIGVFGISITDGSGDGLPTIIKSISFSANAVAQNTVNRYALFNGNALIAGTEISNPGASISFTGLNITVSEGTAINLTLRASFHQTAPAVNDHDRLEFAVANSAVVVDCGSISSQLNNFTTINSSTVNHHNHLSVTATKLLFSTVSDGTINVNLPAFTISAADANNRLDVDVSGLISITTSGIGMSGGTGNNLSNGAASVSNVQFNAAQGPITLAASAASLTGSSNGFNISAQLPAAQGSYLSTTGTGSYHDVGSWSRCNQIGGCTGFTPGAGGWGALGANATPIATTNVYIQGVITLTNALGVANSTILSGGNLIVENQHAVTGSLTIKSGGTVTNNDRLNFGNTSATFTIEDGGNLILNNYQDNPNNSLWNGAESFAANSNVYVNYANNGALLFSPETIVAANAATGSKFGNLYLQPTTFRNTGHWSTSGIFPNGTYQLTKNDFIVTSADRNLTFNGTDITIGRDMIINADGSGDIVTSSASGTNSLNVMRDVIKNGTGIFRLNGSGNSALNIDRDLTINAGSFRFGGFLPSTISNLNLKGNLLIATNAVLEAGDAASFANNKFNFNGTYDNIAETGIQTIDVKAAGPDKNRYISFAVKSGAYAQLKTQDLVLGHNSSLNLEAGSIFNFGFNGSTALVLNDAASSTTSFTMAGAAKIFITHPNGIDATGTAALDGNVRTDTRTYSTSGIYHYIGKAPFQRVGDGLAFGGSSAKHVIVELDALSTQLLVEGNSGASTSTFNLLDIGLASTGNGLKIIQGTVIGRTGGDFWGTGKLEMTGGEYRISTITSTPSTQHLPRLSGYSSYSLSGGTIHLNGVEDVQILSGTPAYYRLKFTGANTLGTPTDNQTAVNYKGISSAINTSNLQSIEIADNSTIVDVQNNFGAANTALTMSGGRLRIGVGGTQPASGGSTGGYTLTGGVIEFYNSSAISIRQSTASPQRYYQNIEVSGSNVSSSGITLQDAGSFTVNKDGVFTPDATNPDDAHITGLTGSQTLTVKAGGKFITKNTNGFSGAANTSVTNEIDNIVLETYDVVNSVTGSTVEYAKEGNQSITNNIPYANLTLTGNGNKNAPLEQELIVLGNLSGAGDASFVHSNGTVQLAGTTAAQSYSATAARPFVFYNLALNNNTANGININSNLSLLKKMSFASDAKQLNIAADKLLIIKSSDSLTGQVAEIPAGYAINYNTTGKFEVERWLPANRAWRFVSTPVQMGAVNGSPSIKDSWQEKASATGIGNGTGYGTIITGPVVANGLDASSAGNSMKWYNQTTNQYVPVNNTDDTIANENGYMVYVRGDRGVLPSDPATVPTNLRIAGRIRTGDQQFSVDANKVRAIGNPYASDFSVAELLANNVGKLGQFYYAWDPTLNGYYGAGGFQTFHFSDGYQAVAAPEAGASSFYVAGKEYPVIESGQAFFVQSMIASATTITITEGMKADSNRLASRGGTGVESQRQFMRTKLYTNTGAIADGNMVAFDEVFSNNLDGYDAPKFINGGENFGMERYSTKLAVEARNIVQPNDTIYYSMSNLKEQGYTLVFTPENMAATGMEGLLVDRFLNTQTPVNLAGPTTVNISVTSQAASKAANRFYLVFRAAAGPLPVSFVSVAAQRQADRSITVNWKVANEINIVKYEVERSANGSNFTGILNKDATGASNYSKTDLSPLAADNFYRIKAIGIAGDITYSSIVKVAPENGKPIIAVTPNPVKDKQMNIRFEQQPGAYTIQLGNNLGQVVYNGNLQVSSAVETKTIALPAILSAGTYQLSIRNKAGEVVYAEAILVE